jgi:biotin transport system substrate-specific component
MPHALAIDPEPTPPDQIHNLARIALYAALIGAGAFVHVPVGPMHISLQTLMIMLTGFVLGPRRAALALLLYNVCGFIGLPMYGRGRAGPASYLGPTAGYFAGFLAGAVIAGGSVYFTGSRRRRVIAMIVFGFIGSVVTLLLGTALLRLRFIPEWNRALMIGFAPFIIGDTLKMLAAVAIKEVFLTREPHHA